MSERDGAITFEWSGGKYEISYNWKLNLYEVFPLRFS